MARRRRKAKANLKHFCMFARVMAKFMYPHAQKHRAADIIHVAIRRQDFADGLTLAIRAYAKKVRIVQRLIRGFGECLCLLIEFIILNF